MVTMEGRKEKESPRPRNEWESAAGLWVLLSPRMSSLRTHTGSSDWNIFITVEENNKTSVQGKGKGGKDSGKGKGRPGGRSRVGPAEWYDADTSLKIYMYIYIMTTVRVLSTTEMQRLHAVIVPVCIIWKFATLSCLMNISSLEISEAMARWHPRCVLEALSWCYSLLIAMFT